MASSRLFGKDIAPACRYCAEGFPQKNGEQVLCMKKGIMPGDHSCKKFRYDPLLRVPARPLSPEIYTEEDFRLEEGLQELQEALELSYELDEEESAELDAQADEDDPEEATEPQMPEASAPQVPPQQEELVEFVELDEPIGLQELIDAAKMREAPEPEPQESRDMPAAQPQVRQQAPATESLAQGEVRKRKEAPIPVPKLREVPEKRRKELGDAAKRREALLEAARQREAAVRNQTAPI